jgi:hypothetical protein
VFNVSIRKLIDWNVLDAQLEKPLRALCKYFEAFQNGKQPGHWRGSFSEQHVPG